MKTNLLPFGGNKEVEKLYNRFPYAVSFRYTATGILFGKAPAAITVNYSAIEQVTIKGKIVTFLLTNGIKYTGSVYREDMNIVF